MSHGSSYGGTAAIISNAEFRDEVLVTRFSRLISGEK